MLLLVINAQVEERMRIWLASALGASAAWRRGKAEKYSNDARNSNSMVALFSAAGYVRDKSKQGGGIYHMTELVAACDQVEYDLTADGFAGSTSERLAGRYGFDGDSPPVDDGSHDQLLRNIFLASLEDLRDQLEDDIPPGSRLAELITEHLPARLPAPEEATVVLLTEIRDLLRDRLPAEGKV